MIAKRLKPVPIEAIARGYLIGSGWKDYQATGSLCGIALPPGLRQAEQLPEPIFTPSTKAAVGDARRERRLRCRSSRRSAPISPSRCATRRWRSIASRPPTRPQRGIIIADTKFEFGTDADGKLYVMDEMLTPDSSRFWPADEYRVGISPPSYDKQFVRDYLETLDWNKTAPGPTSAARSHRRHARRNTPRRCSVWPASRSIERRARHSPLPLCGRTRPKGG